MGSQTQDQLMECYFAVTNRYEIGWTKDLDQEWREVEAARGAPLYEGTGDFWWAWALQARCLDLGRGLGLSWTRPKLGLECSYEEGTLLPSSMTLFFRFGVCKCEYMIHRSFSLQISNRITIECIGDKSFN